VVRVGLAGCAYCRSWWNAAALEPDQLPQSALHTAHIQFKQVPPLRRLNGQAHARFGIPNIDSLVNWNDQFFGDGFDSAGNPNRHWYTNTLGNPPQHHGTTFINAPIVPVIVDMRNADGSARFVGGTRLISDPTPFLQLVLDSPIFSNANFSSSPVPTQFNDAVQRAQYYATAKDDWHTILVPGVIMPQTMVFIEGTYYFALNDDGSCCFYVLVDSDAFFTALNNVLANIDITTKDLTTFLSANAFIYDHADPTDCCTQGFHTYAFEPADPESGNIEKRWVLNYSAWIGDGVFANNIVTDIVTLSHEIAETYNDPFIGYDGVHNITPWWWNGLFICANLREGGDVVQGVTDINKFVFPILMSNGFTYHPQNIALLSWFAREFPSSALHGAYSYPDETAVTGLGPPNLKPGCGLQ
jgi:hypothetical protein